MDRHNLRKVDIGIMVVFEAMMQERSVTRVGEKYFMAQATVSASLTRLRAFFDDPLFVRVGHRMEPTARALEIYDCLSPALDGLAEALSVAEGFDPLTSMNTFRFGMSDDVEVALLPGFLHAIREEAPNINIVIVPVDSSSVTDRLVEGSITLAVSPAKTLPANAKRKLIRRTPGFILRCDKGPPLTLDEYCERPHVQVGSVPELGDAIDNYLTGVGVSRRVILSVPKFSALPSLLAGNPDLLTVLPEHAARVLADTSGMWCEPTPFEIPSYNISMAWMMLQDMDPSERWFRKRVERHMGSAYVRSSNPPETHVV